MTNYNWNYPTTIWAGENRILDLALACKQLSISKPLFVTDSGLSNSDIVLGTLKILKNNSINIFEKCSS